MCGVSPRFTLNILRETVSQTVLHKWYFIEKGKFVMNFREGLNSGSTWRLAAEQHAWLIVFLLQQSTGWLSGCTRGVTRKRISFFPSTLL
jgi:hypothetical protein